MSNKNKSRIRQYGSLLLCSILCVVFLAAPVRAADLDEDIDAAETTKTNVTAKPQSEVLKQRGMKILIISQKKMGTGVVMAMSMSRRFLPIPDGIITMSPATGKNC